MFKEGLVKLTIDIRYNKLSLIFCHNNVLLTCLEEQDESRTKNHKKKILVSKLKLNNNN